MNIVATFTFDTETKQGTILSNVDHRIAVRVLQDLVFAEMERRPTNDNGQNPLVEGISQGS